MKTKRDPKKNTIDVSHKVMNRIETFEKNRSQSNKLLFNLVVLFTLLTSFMSIFFLEKVVAQYKWLAHQLNSDINILKIFSQGLFLCIFIITAIVLVGKIQTKTKRQTQINH